MADDAGDRERIADELAVRRLVDQYADAVTHANESSWIATWAEDGCWQIGGRESRGHAELLATWRSLMGLFQKVLQLPQTGLLDLAGDAGSGRWSVVELGRSAAGSSSVTLGTYHDVYRRTGARWEFAERRFEFVYTGPPDLSGAWLG
jgi:hypothetical protein